jgi:Protein of unknown function (DUF4232)
VADERDLVVLVKDEHALRQADLDPQRAAKWMARLVGARAHQSMPGERPDDAKALDLLERPDRLEGVCPEHAVDRTRVVQIKESLVKPEFFLLVGGRHGHAMLMCTLCTLVLGHRRPSATLTNGLSRRDESPLRASRDATCAAGTGLPIPDKEPGMNLLSRASARVATGIAVASTAILLPVAALALPGGPAHHLPATVAPRCGVAMPELPGGAFVWLGQPGDGFAGGVGYQLEITNTGRGTCTLRGVPRIAAIRDGRQVGKPVPGSNSGPLVTLRPGQTAHTTLIVHNASSLCRRPVSASVVIYLPGRTTAQPAWLTAAVCPNKGPGGGVLRVGTISAGVGIPLYTTV